MRAAIGASVVREFRLFFLSSLYDNLDVNVPSTSILLQSSSLAIIWFPIMRVPIPIAIALGLSINEIYNYQSNRSDQFNFNFASVLLSAHALAFLIKPLLGRNENCQVRLVD